MIRNVSLTLPIEDVLQIRDGITFRAESYQYTARFLNEGQTDDAFFAVEEVRNAEEALQIAQHYRDIVAQINKVLADERSPGMR